MGNLVVEFPGAGKLLPVGAEREEPCPEKF
jgi:hypothetical protein